jgi:hypothetical protein
VKEIVTPRDVKRAKRTENAIYGRGPHCFWPSQEAWDAVGFVVGVKSSESLRRRWVKAQDEDVEHWYRTRGYRLFRRGDDLGLRPKAAEELRGIAFSFGYGPGSLPRSGRFSLIVEPPAKP